MMGGLGYSTQPFVSGGIAQKCPGWVPTWIKWVKANDQT